MKILVTGGEGLVGSAIDATYRLSRRDCDLTNRVQTEEIFKKLQPEGVIHCAAKVGGLGSNMQYKGEYFYENILMNTHVIEAARLAEVKRLAVFLSTCVFPDTAHYPLTVDQIHKGEPHASNYPYAYAKRMADIQLKAYREQYELPYISVIPCNIYGPYDNFSLQHGHVIPMLIHKLYQAQRTSSAFVVWGTGRPLREFIFSKDVAKLTTWALEHYTDPEPLIFSGKEEISIKDLVDLLVRAFHFKGKVIFDHTKPDGQMRKPSDRSKIQELLPSFTYTPLEQGIQETVNWLIENYETART